MIRVGMITTTAPERCGLRVYSEELVRNARLDNPDIEFHFIGRPFDGSVIDRCADVEIVHVQHVNNLFGGFTLDHILQLKALGKKTICTYHDSTTDNRSQFTLAFDRVVVHQPTSDGFDYIYHGVPWRNLNPLGMYRDFIGTSGFPIPFKNYPLAAKLAREVGMKLYAILPDSPHGDVNQVTEQIMRECPGSVVDRSFPDHQEIISILSECSFTLFPYRHETTGVGGSMRVGIGAQRPVVISNVIRFADVLHEERFRNEFYIIDSAYPTFEQALPVVKQCATDVATGFERIPKLTLEKMSWRASANKYAQIYRELVC